MTTDPSTEPAGRPASDAVPESPDVHDPPLGDRGEASTGPAASHASDRGEPLPTARPVLRDRGEPSAGSRLRDRGEPRGGR